VPTRRKLIEKFYNYQFILLTFLFRARCMHRKFQLQDLRSYALAWWCQKHHLTTHTRAHAHARTHTHTSLTTFLFTQSSLHMRHRHEPRTTYVCWVLFQYTNMRYHFQYVFHDGNQEFLHCISLLPQGKSKTGIFQQLSKNA